MISNEDCFLRNYLLAQISSNRTFCAGGNKAGPCLGDSGGGFYTKSGKLWIMDGIISAAILNDDGCDINTYASFTCVSLFTLWVKSVIEGEGSSGTYKLDIDNDFGFERFDGDRR